jgi:hypothetical protein
LVAGAPQLEHLWLLALSLERQQPLRSPEQRQEEIERGGLSRSGGGGQATEEELAAADACCREVFFEELCSQLAAARTLLRSRAALLYSQVCK